MTQEEKEMIKGYLLDENISEEERKERFEIAWDICENFKEIKLSLKQRMLDALMNKISSSNEFRGYEVRDKGLRKGEKYGLLIIFKKDWVLSSNSKIGILNYAFEAEQEDVHENLVGIVMQSGIVGQDEGIPFKGDWREFANDSNELLRKCSEKCNEIYKILNESSRSRGWNVTKGWIAWKWLDLLYKEMREKKFYLQILTKGDMEKAVEYFFDELSKLKDKTEKYIDELIEFIKIHLKAGIEG